MSEPEGKERNGVSRRHFLRGLGAGGIGSTLLPYGALADAGVETAGQDAAAIEGAGRVVGPGPVPITLDVNGETVQLRAEPRDTLLDVLRQERDDAGDYVDLTGAKRVCDRASCGACSMIVGDRLVYGCTYLAVAAQGKEVVTVEGLGAPDAMSAVQRAFVERDALMCGFCTPGMVVAVTALLDENPDPSREEIRRSLDGNICRCGTYVRIFEATEQAASELREA